MRRLLKRITTFFHSLVSSSDPPQPRYDSPGLTPAPLRQGRVPSPSRLNRERTEGRNINFRNSQGFSENSELTKNKAPNAAGTLGADCRLAHVQALSRQR